MIGLNADDRDVACPSIMFCVKIWVEWAEMVECFNR